LGFKTKCKLYTASGFAHHLLPSEKFWMPIEQETGWAPELVWMVLVYRKSLALAVLEFEFPDRPVS
jgi:hypothetical protein